MAKMFELSIFSNSIKRFCVLLKCKIKFSQLFSYCSCFRCLVLHRTRVMYMYLLAFPQENFVHLVIFRDFSVLETNLNLLEGGLGKLPAGKSA